MTLTFPRELRLLTPSNFQFVFQQPHSVGSHQLTILGRKNTLTYPRLGLIVAKKVAKRACDRNRIKRFARESFRLQQHNLLTMDYIVIAKKGIVLMDPAELHILLDRLWVRYHQ